MEQGTCRSRYFFLRPDQTYLMLEPCRSNVFHFQKKRSCDWINTRTRLCHRPLICGSAWKLFQAALCYSGPDWPFIVNFRWGQVLEEWLLIFFFYWPPGSVFDNCQHTLWQKKYVNSYWRKIMVLHVCFIVCKVIKQAVTSTFLYMLILLAI